MIVLLACSGGGVALVAEREMWVEDPKVGEGEAVLLHAPVGTVMPSVEGVTISPAAEPGTFEIRGANGSYVVELPGSKASTTLFLDIGVDGPKSELDDIAAIAPPGPPLWPWVLAGLVASAALVGVGVLTWLRLRPPPAPPPAEPPERIARREWALLRARTDLAPDVLAAGLSGVFRRYLQATHAWPATSRTSREILDALAGDLPAVQVERARRLLFAMDIVRFSDRSTHADFFASLDADFEALLTQRVRRPGA